MFNLLFVRVKAILFLPLYFIVLASRKRDFLLRELAVWESVLTVVHYESRMLSFIRMMALFPEYRSLVAWRLNLSVTLFPKEKVYFVTESDNVGEGLVLQHGFSSIIFAEKIGRNCQIWQNVTIGRAHDKGPRPVIGNNVKICTGSVVLGGITIGDNSIIGANAVVVKNVPPNSVVVGNPAKVVKINGVKV